MPATEVDETVENVVETTVDAAVGDADVQPVVDDTPVEREANFDAPETTPVERPGISDELMRRAQGYNLSADDVKDIGSEGLERLLVGIDRKNMAPSAPQRNIQPVPGQPVPITPATGAEYVPVKLELGDDLDESVVKSFQTVADHVNAQLKEAHGFRQRAMHELQALNVIREFADFDRFIVGLGDDWAKEYGKGATLDMDPQSTEFKTRMEVLHGAKGLRANAGQRRQRMAVSDSQLRSHRAKYWDRIAEQTQTKMESKAERAKRAAGERPTKGKTPGMSPHDEAVAVWNKR